MCHVSALVIDTSSWISYFAGKGSGLIESALEEAQVYLPPVVAAELLSASMSSKDRLALEDLLTQLPLCGTERAHWFRVGKLRALLGAGGVSVSTPDAHIAQCALDLNAELLTEDKVFERIARRHPLRLVR